MKISAITINYVVSDQIAIMLMVFTVSLFSWIFYLIGKKRGKREQWGTSKSKDYLNISKYEN